MNKVITIHLHGLAFQLEEAGYDALRTYLNQAERQLAANPDRAEILADIEQGIADKFRAGLSPHRNVILAAEVQAAVAAMGPVTDSTTTPENEEAAGPANATTAGATAGPDPQPAQPRRLYRLTDGAVVAGVCNGLAAYLGADVSLVRLVTAILTFVSFGTVAIAYGVGALVIPEAKTPEEKAAATSPAPTAQEFIRMARSGYYAGMRSFPDRAAHREWKRKFRHEMRDWRKAFRHGTAYAPPPTTPPPPLAGYGVLLPVLGTLKAAIELVALLAVVLLVATGNVFGITLPGDLPTWAGVVLILIACSLVVAPIKAVRRAYYARLSGWPICFSPLAELLQGIVALFLVCFGFWVADRFVPGFHETVLRLPELCREMFVTFQHWWSQR